MKVTENFSVSPTQIWLCGVVVMTPESIGCMFKYRKFFSLILNTKLEKNTNVALPWCAKLPHTAKYRRNESELNEEKTTPIAQGP